jgi:hypothetical protein
LNDVRGNNLQIGNNSKGIRLRINGSAADINSLGKPLYINYDLGYQRVYIMGSRVGIGTTSPNQKLSVNGDASKVGGGSWKTFSDERLKNILNNFEAGLEEILKLQPIKYRYKKDNSINIPDEGVHIGFSAQEVQKVIPEAVNESNEGYLMVDNDPILWAMLNAIKEQQVQIEQLKTLLFAGSTHQKERLAKLDNKLIDAQ